MSGGGTGSIDVNTTSSPWEMEAQKIQGQNLKAMQPFFNEVMGHAIDPAYNPTPFPDNPVAAMNPVQMAAQGQVLSQAQQLAEGLNPQIQDRMRFGMYDALQLNPYLRNAMDAATNPLVDNFQRNTLPGIGTAAVKAGAFGGSRHNLAQAQAATDLSRQIGDITGQMAFQGYNKGLDTMQNTLQMSPALVQTMNEPAKLLSAVGDDMFAYDQKVKEGQIAQWNAAQDADYNRFERYAKLLGPLTGAMGNYNAIGGGPTSQHQVMNPGESKFGF